MIPWYNPLSLTPTATYTAMCEISDGIYEPPFDLAGKTVLDVGATCGEVAYYYLTKHHASKVVCIENDPEPLPCLEKNKALMNIEIISEGFSVKHLQSQKYDFIKCDCEGHEMVLLEYAAKGGVLPPCVVEVHTNWIKEQFLKAGFKVFKVTSDSRAQVAVYMMNNYGRLGL